MADSDESADAGTPPSPPEPATLGQVLRNARLAQELTVEQIATELRIEVKQLNALENDRLEQIGPPVFVKGYLKQYGPRLGLDIRDLLAMYYKQTTLADVQIKPNRTIKLRDERQITSWVLAAIVLLTLVVGLAVWWWNGGSFAFVRSAPTSTATPAATGTAAAAAPRQPSAARDGSAAPPPTAVDTAPAAPAESAARDEPPPASETRPIPAVVERAAADDAADDRAALGVTVPLVFTFEGDSWTEVTDARGQRLVYGLNTAGRTVRVRGEPPFAVVLGNASSVRLLVDGAPFDIPTPSRQDNLVRFDVNIAEE